MTTLRNIGNFLDRHPRLTAFACLGSGAVLLAGCSESMPSANTTNQAEIERYHDEVVDLPLGQRFYAEYVNNEVPNAGYVRKCLYTTSYRGADTAVIDDRLFVYPNNTNAPVITFAEVDEKALLQPVDEVSEGVLEANGCEY